MSKKEPTLAASYTNYLRRSNTISCPNCDGEFPDIDERIRNHLKDRHADLIEGQDTATLIQGVRRGHAITGKSPEQSSSNQEPFSTTADPGGGHTDSPAIRDDTLSPYKRRKSPASSIKARPRSASPPKRSRARPISTAAVDDPDFLRRSPQQGKLWNPDDGASPSTPRAKPSSRSSRTHGQHRNRPDAVEAEDSLKLIKQPETRPIGQDQLVAEVKGIYAGLVMVEAKCIEVDNAQSSQSDAKLNNEQWQALIALHRTLLHEHHDFFLASQHPSASSALRRLASKYAMPARMWRHGIHSFLELLRHRLPASLEHMLTFIYLAYSMMALLYETVPAFEDTWIECLGDLGRYRMAIEDDDIRDREVWTSVSRHWYSKASDKAPTTGRLYHHLAILARPNALQQLFYYTKSLCVPIPFASARDSIMTLFDPVLSTNEANHHPRLIPIDVAFVKAHGILFSNKSPDNFVPAVNAFLEKLDVHIGRTTRRWMECGYHIGIANCCSLLSYGQEENVIMKAISSRPDETKTDQSLKSTELSDQKHSKNLDGALRLAVGTYEVVFHRLGDPNVLPFLHVVMVFMHHIAKFPDAMAHVEDQFPWKLVSLFLNSLLLPYRDHERLHSVEFPREGKDVPPRPFPEDFAMKGLLWVKHYFPKDWFSNEKIDDDEKYFEVASMTDERKERILWLGCRVAEAGKWLTYDRTLHRFGVTSDYEKEIDAIAKDADMMNISETTDTISRTPTFASATTVGRAPSWSSEKDEEDLMDLDEAPAKKPIIQL
ncbi:Uu.00g113870.m01.CDS01 [Anthostomella pinea]|uniref:Uu.00g113870.m01.CDS01 n=1 Tax=Anthostomella pinea TaxID=933095 RepID=A0AAI8VFK5_9PEZI|nr:Uu.00g113870.m01.CDS01 [Anthostomella pinea]